MISPIFLGIEALLAILVTVAFDFAISKKLKKERDVIFLLALIWAISFVYASFYKFVMQKSEEEYLTFFILLLSSNFATSFIKASLDNKLHVVEKAIMCTSSITLWFGLNLFFYNFMIVSNYLGIFLGLLIIVLSGFVLKSYRLFIPK